MRAEAKNGEGNDHILRRVASEDGLYVLDLSGRQSRIKEKDSSDIEQMIEAHIEPRKTAKENKLSIYSKDQQGIEVHESPVLDPLLKKNPLPKKKFPMLSEIGFQVEASQKLKDGVPFGPIPSELPNLISLNDNRDQQESIEISLKAKTELKVLARHVYQVFLVSNSVPYSKADITELLSKIVLQPGTDINEVSPADQIYCFRRRVNIVFKVFEAVAFLKAVCKEPLEYKAMFKPSK